MRVELAIEPRGYKRMTRFSKHTPAMQAYYAWVNELKFRAKLLRFELPDRFAVTFFLPMPPSWSKTKRLHMDSQPHQQKPDASNLLKAFEDALKENDQTIWDVQVSKFWSQEGRIVVVW